MSVTVSHETTIALSTAPLSYEDGWRHHGRRTPRPNRWILLGIDGRIYRCAKTSGNKLRRGTIRLDRHVGA